MIGRAALRASDRRVIALETCLENISQALHRVVFCVQTIEYNYGN